MRTNNVYKAIIWLAAMCLSADLQAQDSARAKPSTLLFHVFYNDFPTAQLIRTTSLNNALNSGQWKRLADMQMGAGLSYMRGVTKKIDFAGTIDASYTDYLFKNGTNNGSSQFLLDVATTFNARLLNDRHIFNPFLTSGLGASLYTGKAGFYIPAGVGLQANVFNQAFALLGLQYRKSIGGFVNDHFNYSIGIGFSLSHKKRATVPPIAPPVKPADTVSVKPSPRILRKNITIKVKDEQTGLPLPGVMVTLKNADTLIQLQTDSAGNTHFTDIAPDTYTATGTLNGINTNTLQIKTADFSGSESLLNISLTHNDPRFTLAGEVINMETGKPETGVTINLQNLDKNSTTSIVNSGNDQGFNIQLDAGTDFTVSGKKAGYLSNIEKVSTKGLSRSTTLYVKLKLSIQQTQANKAIVLRNIYYDTGSTQIKAEASSDLDKLILFLNDNPGTRIEIDSHTDSRGSTLLNNRLSKERAAAVMIYLVKHNISPDRLTAKGFGASQPVNGCTVGIKCTDTQHKENRRTEFKVLE
ncbi:OmpA family protein [Mucilaginibacter mali]|uniref:OmpA family protein n=1 Tax=Mucilaginibacter mali TaxID=2740462 RepID=A0A7D4QBL8_9SPHI|nr:OmpA family protein [Mucilaginibacter mali]QKJ30604.1 OmpA family protein [Mucilaginibacter mali]